MSLLSILIHGRKIKVIIERKKNLADPKLLNNTVNVMYLVVYSKNIVNY